jgi:DNA primase
MSFPKDFPEKLLSSILLSEVIGKKVKLKHRGKDFLGLCPFHNEKTPSFTVNDSKGFYHCFGCQAHGDVIAFTMSSSGLGFKDAVIKLADDFGILVPKVKFDAVLENKLEKDYFLLEKTAQFFEKNLYEQSGLEAREYLKKRGFNSTIAKKFRLGFALNSYESLTNFLLKEGFLEKQIVESGVIGKNEKNKFYDKFRNRIIFPITDKKNRVIAFGGRTIGDDIPKYLNSSETEVFKKSHTLYNFYFARKSIFDKGFTVVVEGYVDAISLASNGIENVVAGLGTSLGQDHLKELFRITDKIVICLDGDSAGIRAAKRVSEIALSLVNSKKNIAFAFLPNQMDPDDFIQSFGAKELENFLTQSIPLSEALFEFALTELKIDKNKKISAENKAQLELNLTNKIAVIHDHALKKHFTFFFKDLLFSFGRNQKKITTNFSKKIYANAPKNIADNIAKNIIAFIIKFSHLANFRDDIFDIREVQFTSERLTNLKDLVIDLIANEKENLTLELEKSEFTTDFIEIKNIVARLSSGDLDSNAIKFRILLLKDLLLQVEVQYKESLEKIDDIDTHQSAITNEKIKEIFDYKNSLQNLILSLEKQLI